MVKHINIIGKYYTDKSMHRILANFHFQILVDAYYDPDELRKVFTFSHLHLNNQILFTARI